MNEFINKYKNHKFGDLTVVGPEEYEMDKDGNIVRKNVYCDCDCGKKWVVVGINDLLNGYTTSCGCQGRDSFIRVVNSGHMGHGDSKGGIYHELYVVWKNMRSTVSFKKSHGNDKWENLDIDPSWDDYEVFKEWALKNDWSNYKILRRTDIDKGFGPDNCYFSY